MAIFDRARKFVGDRREKAGPVTGKKSYSVMGKAQGKGPRGTKWVRGKKKEAEPKAEAPKPKAVTPKPKAEAPKPAPKKEAPKPKAEPKEKLASEKRPTTGTPETRTQAGGKTPVRDEPVIPPVRKNIKEVPSAREGDVSVSPTVPDEITSVGQKRTLPPLPSGSPVSIPPTADDVGKGGTTYAPSGAVTPSTTTPIGGGEPDPGMIAPPDLPFTPPSLGGDLAFIDETIPVSVPPPQESNANLREFFPENMPGPGESLDQAKSDWTPEDFGQVPMSPVPLPPTAQPPSYADIMRGFVDQYTPELQPLTTPLPNPPAQQPSLSQDEPMPTEVVEWLNAYRGSQDTPVTPVDPYSGSALTAEDQAAIDIMANKGYEESNKGLEWDGSKWVKPQQPAPNMVWYNGQWVNPAPAPRA